MPGQEPKENKIEKNDFKFSKVELKKISTFINFGIISNIKDLYAIEPSKLFWKEVLKFVDNKSLKFLLEKKIINNLDELKLFFDILIENKNHFSLKNFKLLFDKKIITNFGDLKALLETESGKSIILHYYSTDSIIFLLKNDFFTNVTKLLSFFNNFTEKQWADFNFYSVSLEILFRSGIIKFSKGNMESGIHDLFAYDLKTISANYSYSVRDSTKGVSVESYSKLHPLLILFGAVEDFDGDLKNADEQVREILRKYNLEDSRDYSKCFEIVVKELKSKFENKIEKYRPTYNQGKRRENIKKINNLQAKYLLAHEREHLAEKAEKSEDRTLVLYIRQGHGHMDAFKFSLMAKFIYEYVTSGRSPIFNKVKIVSYHAGDYPKMIHDLGIPESTYNSERGFDFERNAIGGNMVLFSHANATTQQNLGSIPIIGLGALRNTDKYNKEKYFVPLRSFHDKNDNAVNFPKLDDGFWKKYKDRGRDLDRMLLAFAASVFALENKMLNQINQAD